MGNHPTPTIRELYGDKVCDAVLEIPFDDDVYLMIVNNRSKFGDRCCIVGALNIVSAHRRGIGMFEVMSVPFRSDLSDDYYTATGKLISPEGERVLQEAYQMFDRTVLGGPRVEFVKQLLAKPEAAVKDSLTAGEVE